MKRTKEKFYTQDDFFKLFDQFINDSVKGRRTKKDGKKIRNNTIDSYTYCKKVLQKFTEEKNFDLKLFLVDKLTRSQREKTKAYWKKFFKEFTDYLYFELDYYDNYVGNIIKGLRTFFNYLINDCNLIIGNYHKSFYVPHEEIPIIVLNPRQLNYLIYDKELNDKLPDYLKTVKDIFVFGCTVALRVSDLMALSKENLEIYNNNYYIKTSSQKTGAKSSIKLPDYGISILKKYDSKKQKTLLPTLSIAWYNTALKKLARYMDFNEPMKKYRNKRGEKTVVYKNKEKKEHYILADHITTHTMRRTGITTLLILGVPADVVRKISGHKPASKEFFRYVEYAQGYIDNHTDNAFSQITNALINEAVLN